MTVAMLGAVGGQAPLAAFIQKVEWRHALQVIGLLGLVLAGIFWIVIRDRSPDRDKDRHIVSTRISLFKSLKQGLKKSSNLVAFSL